MSESYLKNTDQLLLLNINRVIHELLEGVSLVRLADRYQAITPKWAENRILEFIDELPEQVRYEMINRLVRVASREQFREIFLAKRIISKKEFSKSDFCKVEGITREKYDKICATYVPIIQEQIKTELERIKEESSSNASECHLSGKRNIYSQKARVASMNRMLGN